MLRSQTTPENVTPDVAITIAEEVQQTPDEEPLPAPSANSGTSTIAAAAVQQVHIISSDEDEINKKAKELNDAPMSNSSSGSFKGFSSPGTTMVNTNAKIKRNLKRNSHSNELQFDIGIVNAVESRLEGLEENGEEEKSSPIKKKKDNTLDARNDDAKRLHTEKVHIVEINSNSTTDSLKMKRAERNNRARLGLKLYKGASDFVKANPHAHCSDDASESSSECPISSPSNPGERKFEHSQRLLKNTLPADAFERTLMMLTTKHPQLTSEDKVAAWYCSTDLSDVEDVNSFDNLFKQSEEEKRKTLKSKRKQTPTEKPNEGESSGDYDFMKFRKRIQNITCTIEHKRNIINSDDDVGVEQKNRDREKPTTSAAVLGVNKRLKSGLAELNVTETKRKKHILEKQLINTNKKPYYNSTTPPITSSDDEVECYPGQRQQIDTPKSSPEQKVLIHEEILCPSSSETSLNQQKQKENIEDATKTANINTEEIQLLDIAKNVDATDSVFRLHRLNREIDKNNVKNIISVRSDIFQNEQIHELFKKPKVPKRYQNSNITELNETDIRKGMKTRLNGRSNNVNTVITAQRCLDAHQQHEFYNYLGLTEMSTKRAVDDAKEELSRQDYARRSLRVLRMQQNAKNRKKENVKPAQQQQSTTKKDNTANIAKKDSERSTHKEASPSDETNNSSPITFSKAELTADEEKILIATSNLPDQLHSENNLQSTSPKNCTPTQNGSVLKTSLSHYKSCNSSFGSFCSHIDTMSDHDHDSNEQSLSPIVKHDVTLRNDIQFEKSTERLENSSSMLTVNTAFIKYQNLLKESRQMKPEIRILFTFASIENSYKHNCKINESIQSNTPVPPPDKCNVATSPIVRKPSKKHGPLRALRKTKTRLCQLFQQSLASLAERQLRNRKINIAKHHVLRQKNKAKIRSIPVKEILLRNKDRKNPLNLMVNGNKSPYESNTIADEVFLSNNNIANKVEAVQTVPGSHLVFTNQRVENDYLLVSSTTNGCDETALKTSNHFVDRSIITKEKRTESKSVQCTPVEDGVRYITSTPSKALCNPLKKENGSVLYIYYEYDELIVVQEHIVSFWKFSKINALLAAAQQGQQTKDNSASPASSPSSTEWIYLDECERPTFDFETYTPYANRICVHNSMPIYVEMRGHDSIADEYRECDLTSIYVNIYYYNDEEMRSKMHSIQLDSIRSSPSLVKYTTIAESRYFIMCWPQEGPNGIKTSGVCKYSFTPTLDTLASIREFKSLNYHILSLECTQDYKLIGFGLYQVTVWDHRSGDILMNYNLGMPLGRNLSSLYYPNLEIGQNNILLLYQYLENGLLAPENVDEKLRNDQQPSELMVIACEISHLTPSHRVLMRQQLPVIAFNETISAINSGDHLIIMAPSEEELWVKCADPNMIVYVPAQKTKRFYGRGRTALIELSDTTLNVDSVANYLLKLAASSAMKTDAATAAM